VRFLSYYPLTETASGMVVLELYNDQNKSSDPVELQISDLNLVARQQVGGPVQVPIIPAGKTYVTSFKLVPQLTVGFTTVEEAWDKWRARYSTQGIRILARTNPVGDPNNVHWHQPPVAGPAGQIRCGVVPSADASGLPHVRACVTARVAALMTVSDGVNGFYLKEVKGPVLAAANETFVFEPASSIKVIINYHAFRRMESDPNLKLSTLMPWFIGDGDPNGCPKDWALGIETLNDALKGMMQISDNRQTQALRVFLGEANINMSAWLQAGMVHTLYQHRDGCGADAMAHPNKMTLADAGLLYEGVATGTLLNSTSRKSFYSVMAGKTSSLFGDLQSVVTEEMPVGMSPAKQNSFLNEMDIHFKPGSYGLSDGYNRTLAGSVTIPFNVNGATVHRDFVFGFFVSKATTQSKADIAWAEARLEVVREQIREALRNW
jgi:hypothetical protein